MAKGEKVNAGDQNLIRRAKKAQQRAAAGKGKSSRANAAIGEAVPLFKTRFERENRQRFLDQCKANGERLLLEVLAKKVFILKPANEGAPAFEEYKKNVKDLKAAAKASPHRFFWEESEAVRDDDDKIVKVEEFKIALTKRVEAPAVPQAS